MITNSTLSSLFFTEKTKRVIIKRQFRLICNHYASVIQAQVIPISAVVARRRENMRRVLYTALLFAVLACVAACATPQGEITQTPDATTKPPATEAPVPETSEPGEEIEPAPSEPVSTPEPTPEKEPWSDMYVAFVEENYEKIYDSFHGGMTGVGFADLDLDGAPEMIIFDQGASISLGANLFDIIDDKVECVSAANTATGEALGGDNLSELYVYTNFFDEFKLLTTRDGKQIFCVESINGAIDFSINELISFSSDNGTLILNSELYSFTEYDEESGEELASEGEYRISGNKCTKDEYEEKHEEFFSSAAVEEYTVSGVFRWEDASYDSDYEGFMAMVSAAIEAYTPVEK